MCVYSQRRQGETPSLEPEEPDMIETTTQMTARGAMFFLGAHGYTDRDANRLIVA